MAGSTLLVGILQLAVDGASYSIKDGIEFRPSVVTRETIVAQTGDIYYKEVPIAGQIKANFIADSNVSVDSFNAMTNSNIVIIAANGVTVNGSGMWTVETQSSNLLEGVFEVTFEGPTVFSTTA